MPTCGHQALTKRPRIDSSHTHTHTTTKPVTAKASAVVPLVAAALQIIAAWERRDGVSTHQVVTRDGLNDGAGLEGRAVPAPRDRGKHLEAGTA